MKIFKYTIVLFVLSNFVNCRGSIFYWRHVTHKFPDQSESYIQFKMPNQFSYKDQLIKNEIFHARFYIEDKVSKFKPNILINPNQGLNIFEQWRGFKQFELSTGCIYKIPIPEGENKFEFYISLPRILPATLIKNVIVPRQSSLILKFEVVETEVSFVHPSDQAFKNPKDIVPIIEKKPKLEIVYSVEPNVQIEESDLCYMGD